MAPPYNDQDCQASRAHASLTHQMSTEIVVMGVVLLAVLLAMLLGMRNTLKATVQRSLGELREGLLQQGMSAELRHTERLGKHFLDAQERQERALAQGRAEMQNGLLKTTQALEIKFQSLETQVGLRLETIGKSVETKLNENLKEGFKHFEKVQQHLQAAELKLASLNTVSQSISDLNSLLKLPHLRGGFGEATLERLLADFLPAGSFELQYCVVPGTTERVDAIVRMAKQVLPIDSKFPREQVLPLFESSDPVSQEQARKTLSDWIKVQARSIAQKYIRPDHGTTDLALLFLPSETLYLEVVRNGKLFEEISKLKVYPVSPNTLSIGLRSVTMAQEYYDMARGVEKTIEDVKKARRHFEHFERKFEDIGKGLRKAQDAFEVAHTHLGHYETSVYRLTGDLGTPSGTDLPEVPSDRITVPQAQLPLEPS